MRMMYSNFTKNHAFPLAIRVSSKPRCFKSLPTSKPQSLRIGSYLNPSLNPENSLSFKPICFSIEFHQSSMKLGSVAKARIVSSGFSLKNAIRTFSLVRARSLSSFSSQGVSESNGLARAGNALPWLASNKAKEVKASAKAKTGTGRSSWGESAERLEKVSGSSREQSAKRLNKVSSNSSWEESARNITVKNGTSVSENRGNRNRISTSDNRGSRNRTFTADNRGSRNRMISTADERGSRNRTFTADSRGSRNRMISTAEDREGRNRTLDVESDWRRDHIRRDESIEEEGDEVEETEVIDDPRWDKIKNRFRGVVDVKGRYDAQKPELRRWNNQENWGKKTWREATESTLPKMVGEGVYGVGPVLAALSSGRREFYALYVQEGLDLSSNNRKKKDKKGFETVLRMAEKIGLSVKDASKHDLNMIVDNRPHQGLVLDASPLEMVKIMELDPVSVEEDRGSLWVALDEVTDPQNLGAIIRSAYFFGASGVVLCAKNSAPLSGVVSKASAGSLEFMELRYCKNMMQFLTSSAENGWRVLGGSVSSNSILLNEVLPGAPTILVLGSEGTGLRPLVERSCTQLIKIPGNIPVDITAGRELENVESTDMRRGCSGEEFRSFMAVESLNVSVATGVLLHHLIGNNPAQAE